MKDRFAPFLSCMLWMLVLSFSTGCTGPDRDSQTPAPAVEAPPSATRNPFGLDRDVVDCCGPEVREFAEQHADGLGAADDPNAEAWAQMGSGPFESIDGEWAARWGMYDQPWTSGTATIRTVGGRIFIHYRDSDEYLIEAERQDDLLIGRYIGFGDPLDTSPWVGRIVGDGRIDGAWLIGRWDFRRGGREGPERAGD